MSFTESVSELVERDKSGLLADVGGFSRVPLGELCDVLNGFPFKSKQFSTTEGVPLMRIRDVVRGETETYYAGEFDDRYLVQQGELVVGMDGDFNSALWRGRSSLLNQRVCKVTPKDERVSLEFVAYALPGYLKAINAHTSSITVKHLSSKTIAQIPLPVPPREVQESLVAALDSHFSRLDDAVANLERVQRNLKRYRASVLKAAVEGRLVPSEAELARAEGRDYEPASVLLERILVERRRRWEEAELEKMLAKGKPPKNDTWKAKYKEPAEPELDGLPELPEGWCWASVDQVGDVLLGRQRAPQYLKGLTPQPYLRVANIKDDRIDFSDLETMDFDGEHYTKYRLAPGDILVSEGQSPELLGQSAIFRGEVDRLFFQKTLHRFRPLANGPDPSYAQLVFRSHVKNGVFKRLGSITTNIAHLTLTKFRSSPFPLPPYPESVRIVREVDRLMSLSAKTEESVRAASKRCVGLRSSVLAAAFSGQLTTPTIARLHEALA